VGIRLQNGLPFISARIAFQGNHLTLENVLLDTGSAGTIFSADRVGEIGIFIEPGDDISMVTGIGGHEYVFHKTIDSLIFGTVKTGLFEIEVGAMEYGQKMDGIVGLDVLMRLKAIIDFSRLELAFNKGKE
jgi:hypothetical protein